MATVAAVAPALAEDVARPAGKAKVAAARPDKEADKDQAKKKDVSVALKAYDAGARAYEAGKMDQAIQSLTTALNNGGLPSQQMAKALYFRGAAYRKQGKPAQAISDLTTAVWLKNGLSDADRAQAVDQRQSAYREAGLGEAPPASQQRGADAPAAVAAASRAGTGAPPPPVITPGAQVSVPGSSSMFSWLDTKNFGFGGSSSTAAPAAAPAPAPAPAGKLSDVAEAPAPVAPSETVTSSWSTTAAAQSETVMPPSRAVAGLHGPESRASRQDAFSPAAASVVADETASGPARERAPREDAPQQVALDGGGSTAPAEGPSGLEKAGSTITGFFGNIFKGSGQPGAEATQSASSPVTTSATGAAPAAPATGAAAMSWGPTATAGSGKVEKQAALEPPAPALPTHAKGSYRLQVAAVRSREEADEVATRVKAEGRAALGGRLPTIDEAVIGNMGTFYRVRVGPYANAAEPEELCGSLRPKGYDCLVVTQ